MKNLVLALVMILGMVSCKKEEQLKPQPQQPIVLSNDSVDFTYELQVIDNGTQLSKMYGMFYIYFANNDSSYADEIFRNNYNGYIGNIFYETKTIKIHKNNKIKIHSLQMASNNMPYNIQDKDDFFLLKMFIDGKIKYQQSGNNLIESNFVIN